MKIRTYSGEIEGVYQNALYQFKGIPFAQAKRFKSPSPITWKNCLDCTHFRDKSPQIEKDNPHFYNQSEDCLNLNIYTPSLHKNLPVLIEIHGGAFQNGSNQKMNPVHVIGQDEFIYITINYRLGVLGYLYLGEELGKEYQSSGNNGLLDQLAAIKWIYQNIECFGGDNQRITLLGSSAGAKSIAAILSIPEMKKYFQQVILMSGAYQSIRDIQTAQKITEKFKQELHLDDFKDILNVPTNQLLIAQSQICQTMGSTCYFGPVCDDIVISSHFMKNYKLNSWKGNVIIGSSLYEMAFIQSMPNDTICKTMMNLFGKNFDIVFKDYQKLSQSMSASNALTKVLSDYMYRTYSYRFAQILSNSGSNIYQYTSSYLPAFHCFDHSIAFRPDKPFPNNIDKSEALVVGKDIRNNFIHFVLHHSPEITQWQPLSIHQSQIIWDKKTVIKDISIDDVCQNISEQVFIL